MSVQIWVMGEVGLSDKHGEPIRLTSRRSWGLLAFLALSGGRVIPRTELADFFWPDRSGEQARASLRQELAVARKALRVAGVDPIETTKETVQYTGAPFLADVGALEHLIQSGSVEDIMTAAALYRGPLLSGISLRAPDFEDWLSDERLRLKTLAVDAFADLLEASERSGEGEVIETAAEGLLAAEPADERGHRALMRLYLASDRSGEANRQAELCRVAMHMAGKRVPSEETQALIDEIRAAPIPGPEWRPTEAEEKRPGPKLAASPGAQAGPTPPRPAIVATAKPVRELATVLVAHVPGLAQLDPQFDPGAVGAAAERFGGFVRRAAEQADGVVLPSLGDRVVAVFSSESAAARVALLITAESIPVEGDKPLTPACGLAQGMVLRAAAESLSGVPFAAATRAADRATAGAVLVHPAMERNLAGDFGLDPATEGYFRLGASLDEPEEADAPTGDTGGDVPPAPAASDDDPAVHWRRWLSALSRGDLRGAQVEADAGGVSSGTGDPEDLSALMQGVTSLLRGQLLAASDNVAKAADLYAGGPEFGLNPGLTGRAAMAWLHCLQGATGRAGEELRRVLSEMQGQAPGATMLMGQLAAALVQDELGDARGAMNAAREAYRLAADQPRWKALSLALVGRTRDRIGDGTGVSQIEEGLKGYRSQGGELAVPLIQTWLAAAQLEMGATRDATTLVDEALGQCSATGALVFEPELMRLQAVLMVRRGGTQREHLEQAFVAALESARRAGAGLIELRTATSFASHLYSLGRVRDAMARLDRGIEAVEAGGPMPLDMKSALSLRRRVEMG